MDIPESLKTKPPTPLETAKREYNLAMIAMGELDAKVIDTAATLEELHRAYSESVVRVNKAREALIGARSPPLPPQRTPDAEYFEALHAELDGKSREFVLARLTEEDHKRLSAMVKWGSPLKPRVELLLAFVAGEALAGEGLRNADCGQPAPDANGHDSSTASAANLTQLSPAG